MASVSVEGKAAMMAVVEEATALAKSIAPKPSKKLYCGVTVDRAHPMLAPLSEWMASGENRHPTFQGKRELRAVQTVQRIDCKGRS
jgi:hypothetical protein